jgi:hypothetical protein
MLSIEIGNGIRSDLDSESAEKAYPNLPKLRNDWSKHSEYVQLRLEYMKDKDSDAYDTIKHLYPNFKPPHLKNNTT